LGGKIERIYPPAVRNAGQPFLRKWAAVFDIVSFYQERKEKHPQVRDQIGYRRVS
jgi:hypothetical protein